MKLLILALGLILLASCDSAHKDTTESSAPEQQSSREKKTSFGKAVQRARDLDDTSKARNKELDKQLHDATE
jgi:hypothetical protein